MNYLGASTTAPTPTITKDNKEVPNPDYKFWFRLDKLIQNAILVSVDISLASMVAPAINSKQAWDFYTRLMPANHRHVFSAFAIILVV